MSMAITESDTAAWRDLLSWATRERSRTLLDSERLAALYFGELARRGLGGLSQVEAFEHPAALDALAVLLAAHLGDPMRLMDGGPLSSRSWNARSRSITLSSSARGLASFMFRTTSPSTLNISLIIAHGIRAM
jgi:hypothetical protein